MNTFKTSTLTVTAFLSLLTLLMPGLASASWGYASGRLMFYNNQGNYCANDGRDCNGARYPRSQYRVNMPIRDVKVYVRRSSDNVIIGQGVANSSGYYTVYWNSPGAGNVSGKVTWHGVHKDGRFSLKTSSGGTWVFWTYPRTLVNGTTTNFGSLVWGNSSSPNSLANLYDGAVRMWKDALNYSNRMRAYFTNVEIRAYNSAACPTSCANGANKRIIIDSANSAYMPQGRVMHEMGHIASYVSKPRKSFVDYTRDGTNGWNMRSAEYASASFEEGLATFYGDTALYWYWNSEPLTCLSTGACSRSSNNNVETSTGVRASCSNGEERWALTVDRYLRDVYDSSNEWFDNNREPFYNFFDVINRFGNGYDNRHKNEPYGSFLGITWVDDRDGRSARDFRAHMEAHTGTSNYSNFLRNCYPAGD